jgi:hypothetical protein
MLWITGGVVEKAQKMWPYKHCAEKCDFHVFKIVVNSIMCKSAASNIEFSPVCKVSGK